MEIKSAVENLFNQLHYILNEVTDEQYTAPSVSLSGSTIGQHIRHSVEFFTCMLAGEQSGVVNYDKRDRDKRIEEDRHTAAAVLGNCENMLSELNGQQPITLELSYSHTSNDPIRVASNFERELVYNIEHAIHHMALIKIGIKEVAPQLQLPEGFGVANSTIRHKKQQEKISE